MVKHLLTEEGKKILANPLLIPWNEYPRPQMVRDNWICLNGYWDFLVNDNFDINVSYEEQIRVPYPPESLLSGINHNYQKGDVFHYHKQFNYSTNNNHVILHFEAVDQICDVYLNQIKVFHHEGGYLPFEMDITAYLKDCNDLDLVVKDDLLHKYPWGKQKYHPGGIWYTPTSGIWKSVWLEEVPFDYIKSYQVIPSLDQVQIMIDGVKEGVIKLLDHEYPFTKGIVTIKIENPINWTPENPYLYYFDIITSSDKVRGYFALRTLDIKNIGGVNRILLNNQPYLFNGLLDQGFYSDGIYAPASKESLINDILTMKDLGFNTLRKHIKIEYEEFYYQCDKLGMIVFQDMVNNGDYAFVHNSVIPTISNRKISDQRLHKDEEARTIFLESMKETVKLLFNHPCICYWTIFNEGWGQFRADEMYEELRTIDQTRIIDATSGWFHQEKTDVDSLHIYFRKVDMSECQGNLPKALTEFGGYSYKVEDHYAVEKKTFGYKKIKDLSSFNHDLINLYQNEIIPEIKKGLCVIIYTQVSDVEEEVNGLLTYDRKVLKVNDDFKRVIKSLYLR